MKKDSLIIAVLLCGLALPPDVHAFAGANPFDFLFMEAGAKQSALGGAFTTGRNDANVLAYNPAGLAHMGQGHASFMHTAHFAGSSRERIALAMTNGLGASIDMLKFGSISRTTLANPAGNRTAGFTPTAMVVSAGYGLRLTDHWSAGLAGKHIRQNIDSITATAWAADAGIQGVLLEEPPLLVGAALQHFGTRTRFQSEEERLPTTGRGGAALRLAPLDIPLGLSFDLVKTAQRNTILQLGAEASILEVFALRVGYSTRNDSGPGIALGFGIIYKDLAFDYALVPFGNLGASNQFNLSFRWGDLARWGN